MHPGKFTWKELAECAEREVKQRQQVYVRMIENKAMTPAFAHKQIEMMAEIALIMRVKAKEEKDGTDLFGGD